MAKIKLRLGRFEVSIPWLVGYLMGLRCAGGGLRSLYRGTGLAKTSPLFARGRAIHDFCYDQTHVEFGSCFLRLDAAMVDHGGNSCLCCSSDCNDLQHAQRGRC